MKKCIFVFCLFLIASNVFSQTEKEGKKLFSEIENALKNMLLEKWYPLAIDGEDGGFYSEITHDFKIGERHDKMIVTQARHVWTTSKAAEMFPGKREMYLEFATHGFGFLKETMWDEEHGGFHNLVSKKGNPIIKEGEEKTAYGNAFAIYALAAYYKASGNDEALQLAKRAFIWLEENAHDTRFKGYFNTLQIDGTPIERTSKWPSTSDVGYKDQNSSIHLLEAFAELYRVWPDKLLAERLEEMLELVRDVITTEEGYMRLFFQPDWTPVSFRSASREDIKEHYYLDHVSFGHDVETAFLMLEASHALGIENDENTLKIGKKMVDHSLKNGWNEKLGGFYDGGYYFQNQKSISIVNADKNWWAQAEGLNSLFIMSKYFPEDKMRYRKRFDELWDYTTTFLMDKKHGGWYEWGIDTRPETKTALKGHIWKATYHNFRALSNLLEMLEGERK